MFPDPMPKVEPGMAEAFGKAVSSLTRAGFSCPAGGHFRDARTTLRRTPHCLYIEGARFHEQRWKEYGDRLGYAAKLVQEGLGISTADYDNARNFHFQSRRAHEGKLQGDSSHPGTSGNRSCARGPVLHGRCENERPLDCACERPPFRFLCQSAMHCPLVYNSSPLPAKTPECFGRRSGRSVSSRTRANRRF